LTELEASWLARFRAGEERAFRELLDSSGGLVRAWVRPYADDPDDAQDLVQEVWRRVLARRGTFRGDGPVRSWLFAVTRSVCLDSVRREERSRRRIERLAHETPAATAAVRTRRQLDDRLRRAVMELPYRQRQTLLARVLDELSTRETAQLLGCAEGTVKSALSQALTNLRKILEEDIDDF
jgi:RNA polymerase sigma-70 factor (ECF subfamily)